MGGRKRFDKGTRNGWGGEGTVGEGKVTGWGIGNGDGGWGRRAGGRLEACKLVEQHATTCRPDYQIRAATSTPDWLID